MELVPATTLLLKELGKRMPRAAKSACERMALLLCHRVVWIFPCVKLCAEF
jgi:hypothetical protein